jgi:CubicO group peptidase (beta-lactamase class C family)
MVEKVQGRHDGDHVEGTVAIGFESVRGAFAGVVGAQRGTGAAVAIWHDGRWVCDLWSGWADAGRTHRWTATSMVMPYSVTKAFTATCALMLVDRGVVDLDAPVQTYWPEFATPATVRQVLSHQVGVVALEANAPAELLLDWDGLCARLAAEEPRWESGTAIGECALFYGHLVGEIVRRVDGRSLGTFLRDELARPQGLELAIGLRDDELGRAVDLTGVGALVDDIGGPDHPDLLRRALLNPPGALDEATVNGVPWRRAEIPAVNGYATARGAAGLYAALLQDRILTPALRTDATSAQATGIDRVMGGDPRSWGLGFGVETGWFGMGGIGGSYAGACPDDGYAFAFLTGTMGGHDRAEAIENAFRDVIGLRPI